MTSYTQQEMEFSKRVNSRTTYSGSQHTRPEDKGFENAAKTSLSESPGEKEKPTTVDGALNGTFGADEEGAGVGSVSETSPEEKRKIKKKQQERGKRRRRR